MYDKMAFTYCYKSDKIMATIVQKKLKSEYKYTWGKIYYDKEVWCAAVCGNFGKRRKTEREAAKDADIMLIEAGKKPVNILVAK